MKMKHQGIDVNAMDIHKCTPLHWAVARGNVKAVEKLIDRRTS